MIKYFSKYNNIKELTIDMLTHKGVTDISNIFDKEDICIQNYYIDVKTKYESLSWIKKIFLSYFFYKEFSILTDKFSLFYNIFYSHSLKKAVPPEYCNACALRINEIQNRYIVPITYKMTLRLAWLSILIGIGASFYSVFINNQTDIFLDDHTNQTKTILQKSDSILQSNHSIINDVSNLKSTIQDQNELYDQLYLELNDKNKALFNSFVNIQKELLDNDTIIQDKLGEIEQKLEELLSLKKEGTETP